MFVKILKETFHLFFSEFGNLITVILLVWFPTNLFINWFAVTHPYDLKVLKIVSSINEILYPLIVGTVTYLCYCAKSGEPCSGVTALGKGFSYYWPIVKANIIAGIKIVLGFICFFVPGLIFATKYALINPIVICEAPGDEKPRFKSERLTEGNRWSIFFLGFLLLTGPVLLSVIPIFLPQGNPGQTSIFFQALNDSFYDLLSCVPTIAMFLFYWELRENTLVGQEYVNQ